MAGGASGYDSNCSSGHDTFIASGHESRACAACGGAVFTGACCSSQADRFLGACFDNITANECSQIGGLYKGDGSTCLDDDVSCVRRGIWGNCCDGLNPVGRGTSDECIARFAYFGVSGGSWRNPCHLGCLAESEYSWICCFDQGDHWWCQPGATCNPPNVQYDNVTICSMWSINPGVCPGCATGDPSPEAGACYDEGTTTCEQLPLRGCLNSGKVFDPGEACSGSIYPGACCSGCERCIDDMPEYLCDKLPGSVWKGVSTTCAGEDCSEV